MAEKQFFINILIKYKSKRTISNGCLETQQRTSVQSDRLLAIHFVMLLLLLAAVDIQNAKLNDKKRSASGFSAPSDSNRLLRIQFHIASFLADRKREKRRNFLPFVHPFFVALSGSFIAPIQSLDELHFG